ncbi:IclR family transcriptional regulator [Xylophilus sp. ASV27]|uniref:IclR family transcriptional regulator n=1 Tax=Xylophilus sp. ASV27 TaxID=2795129 RepID=UPI0018EC07C9|nr:helix-turn-helix domain-containing protein [Xylophilus sp. ASV27]
MPEIRDKVTAVQRALELLDSFSIDKPHLSMAELARQTSLSKTTALRIARTLQASGYLVQGEGTGWRLGPAAAWLGARYQVSQHLRDMVYPVLRELAAATRHNTSFFARERDARVRLMSVEGDPGKKLSCQGEPLPLDRGSPGKVILAFIGEPGSLYDRIRDRGYHITIGETYGTAASLSAPVFGPGWSVVGALTLSSHSAGIAEHDLAVFAAQVMRAARELSSAIMRSAHREAAPGLTGKWFPSARESSPHTDE